MNKVTNASLKAANLALLAALDEAITEYQDAIAYKSEYLVEKHRDLETIQELRAVINKYESSGREIFKEIQANAVESLQFPTVLRKMWSGDEVAEWLTEQADQIRKN